MSLPLTCWRCGDLGHPWTECDREGAKTPQELNDRVTEIIIRWDAGSVRGFSVAVKTRIIEIEKAKAKS